MNNGFSIDVSNRYWFFDRCFQPILSIDFVSVGVEFWFYLTFGTAVSNIVSTIRISSLSLQTELIKESISIAENEGTFGNSAHKKEERKNVRFAFCAYKKMYPYIHLKDTFFNQQYKPTHNFFPQYRTNLAVSVFKT